MGCLRCDICAELSAAEEVGPCEGCGMLFCVQCAAPYLMVSNYSYCFACVQSMDDNGDMEEDDMRFAVTIEEDEEENDLPEVWRTRPS